MKRNELNPLSHQPKDLSQDTKSAAVLDPTAEAKIEAQVAELKQKLLAEHKQKILSIEKMAERIEDD